MFREDVPLLDYFGNHPWFLQPNYLSALGEGAQELFRRFVNAFAEQMKTLPKAGMSPGVTFAVQMKAHIEALGMNAFEAVRSLTKQRCTSPLGQRVREGLLQLL